MKPEIHVLHRMTLANLQAVENFKVWNEFGSVEFHDKTDLTCVDIADVITIVQGSVEVYDKERHGEAYPEVGQKLNRPATITLNNIKPSQKLGQTAA